MEIKKDYRPFWTRHKKALFIVGGGALMMFGDYLAVYYDAELIFFTGELISLGGWTLFVLALG